MSTGVRHHHLLVLALALALPGSLAACDDKPKGEGDRKSVQQGGTPETEAGRKVEEAKREIEAVEKEMADQDAERFEKSGGEKVERGLP